MVAVPEPHLIWVFGQQHPVGSVAALLPPDAWAVFWAGEGSKGERLSAWAWLQVPEHTEEREGGREQAGTMASDAALSRRCEQASVLAGGRTG